jgi:hypothetical protein
MGVSKWVVETAFTRTKPALRVRQLLYLGRPQDRTASPARVNRVRVGGLRFYRRDFQSPGLNLE